jgi:ElaB/YqjD/DUF883 family membrane-anchored ribosome-binding protein
LRFNHLAGSHKQINFLGEGVIMNEVTRDKLASDFKTLIDDVQELLQTTSSQTGERIADLRERLGKTLDEGRRALSEPERVLREKTEKAKASAEAYLRDKSWVTLGIAAGIGVVLGSLLRRRKGKRSG